VIDDAPFVLGVDLDGVCMDYYGAMKPYAAAWMGRSPETLPDDVSYGFKEMGYADGSSDSVREHYWSGFPVSTHRGFLEALGGGVEDTASSLAPDELGRTGLTPMSSRSSASSAWDGSSLPASL
jgi:hypothetical protein